MEQRIVKFYSKESNLLALHAIPGHFATSNSHINFYIDVTGIRARITEAEEAAKILAHKFGHLNYVDTVVCMDGTEVIGAFLAKEFEKEHISSTNQHKTVYVIAPEESRDNQIIFRDNTYDRRQACDPAACDNDNRRDNTQKHGRHSVLRRCDRRHRLYFQYGRHGAQCQSAVAV